MPHPAQQLGPLDPYSASLHPVPIAHREGTTVPVSIRSHHAQPNACLADQITHFNCPLTHDFRHFDDRTLASVLSSKHP